MPLEMDLPPAQGHYRRDQPHNALPLLRPSAAVETSRALKKTIGASRALAELRGVGEQILNQALLLRSIILQEARISSEIENIVTTNDRLYRAFADDAERADPHTQEVLSYEEAVWHGYNHIAGGGLLTASFFTELARIIKRIDYGVRDYAGTTVVNPRTNETIYTPPQGKRRIEDFLNNLSEYIYEETATDPLIKMAVLHYQFEAIHPFSDGNGRTGRVLNILYLLASELLDLPVLYLSQYIIENKSAYYTGLREVTENGEWENWILYMLEAVERSAVQARARILAIRDALRDAVEKARRDMKSGYSYELIALIFRQPYIRINALVDEGIAQRATASAYLKELERLEILKSVRNGRDIIYLNRPLLQALEA